MESITANTIKVVSISTSQVMVLYGFVRCKAVNLVAGWKAVNIN